jgi:hypothetical protein
MARGYEHPAAEESGNTLGLGTRYDIASIVRSRASA